MFVSHWSREQDSSRLKKKTHCPHCGSWCESWHIKCCYAKHKRCYKCRRIGHIVRVCGRQDPAGEAVKDQRKAVEVAVKSKVKSPSRQASIFAHQGFCVHEALAHLGMITCILTARHPVYNESFHCCND